MRTCTLLLVIGVAAACSGRDSHDPAAKAAAEARAGKAADALAGALMKELKAALESGGPAGAISVCSEKAPQIAKGLAEPGLAVRRASLRQRNPANAPDSVEKAVLDGWERDGKAETVSMVVDGPDGRELRYLRPIRVGPVCLACHGAPESLVADVKAEISRRYPGDLATGYRDGDLRGAFSVRVAMPR
jgi:hypothetical protein